MFRRMVLSLLGLVSPAVAATAGEEPAPLRVATFQVDATPPLGSPLCGGGVKPAAEVIDLLSARGVVLLTDQSPIVLCAIDWVGIGNGGHDAFRAALAEAAGTTPDRVTVHTLHQHDAPACDFTAEELLDAEGLGGVMFDPKFARLVIARTARAVKQSLGKARPVTHVGLGVGVVEKVASNRRILGPDGRVAIVRYSSSRNPAAVAAPEGVIDPKLRLVSLWDGDRPLVSITHYATHPQSYYGRGGVSADFVGMARAAREKDLPDVFHVHFNGASGNVAAGKYNDGSPEMRPVLAGRLAAGMRAAWDAQRKVPIRAADVRWSFEPVALPVRDTLDEERLTARLRDAKADRQVRVRAARDLAFLRRMRSGHRIHVNCLRLGPARVLYLPGELFVEYQLAAQQMRPDDFVAVAAYGDYGPGYIGTEVAYSQGGYETGPVSRTAPQVEKVLTEAIRGLLKD